MKDRSILAILASNALTVGVALWQGWSLFTLLWPFWLQSVIIGWFSRSRILALQNFSTKGFRVNGRAVEPTEETKRMTANFFALHFGIFHAAYAFFLFTFLFVDMPAPEGRPPAPPDRIDLLLMGGLAVAFWLTHRDSFRRHVASDARGGRNIGAVMFLPYARVLPMHVMIIVGMVMSSGGAVLLFGALKTLADVLMHVVEHRWMNGGVNLEVSGA